MKLQDGPEPRTITDSSARTSRPARTTHSIRPSADADIAQLDCPQLASTGSMRRAVSESAQSPLTQVRLHLGTQLEHAQVLSTPPQRSMLHKYPSYKLARSTLHCETSKRSRRHELISLYNTPIDQRFGRNTMSLRAKTRIQSTYADGAHVTTQPIATHTVLSPDSLSGCTRAPHASGSANMQ